MGKKKKKKENREKEKTSVTVNLCLFHSLDVYVFCQSCHSVQEN